MERKNVKKYTPNFSDPRVIKRVNSALDYALANLSPHKPTQWSTRQIDVWFGSQHNPLSKMLRQQLLTVHTPFYNPEKGIAKKYLLNIQGASQLAARVNRTFIPCALHLKQEKLTAADNLYADAIESGNFKYRTVSNRLWNDCQNLDNATRRPLFANYGYVHEYDIRSAAPTLLTQYARQAGLTRPINTIEKYLADPESERSRIAELLEVDRKTAKQLITSRFAGARFGNNNSILEQLDNRWILHNRLQQDHQFEQLTQDIKKLWDAIKSHRGCGRMNASVKWNIYFEQELRVMRSVHRYLDQTGERYFHEHDGWRSTGAIPLRELQLHVNKQTGYWVEFDYDVFER